jgi:prepilin-type N-terminal cleavage/methylation domain-containing protein
MLGPVKRVGTHKGTNQRGFTLVELMIATTVFSLVLLIASSAIVQIGRLYYKGIITVNTQETTRSIVEDISGALQLTKDKFVQSTVAFVPTVATPFTTEAVCIGSSRYTYQIDRKVDDTNKHALWLDDIGSGACVPVNLSGPLVNGRELLGANMRLLRFDVTPPAAGTTVYKVSVRVAFGDNDLLSTYDNTGTTRVEAPAITTKANEANGVCKSGVAGSHFCAVSALDSSVINRLN